MSPYRFSRRALLSRLGPAAAFLPLLNARRGLTAPRFPRRFIVLQPSNGVLHNAWWPSGGEFDFTLNSTMKPLAPHQKQLLVLKGIELSVMRDNKPAGVGAWGGHEALPFMLTNAPGALGQYDGAVKVAVGNALSLDWYLGTKLGSSIPSLVLGSGYVDNKPHWGPMSFKGAAVGDFPARPSANQPEIDPRKVFDRIFAGGVVTAAPAGMMGNVDVDSKRRRRVLDLVSTDLSEMTRFLGGDDRARVHAHLDGLNDLQKELQGAPALSQGCSKPVLPGTLNPTDRFGIDKIIPLQMKMIVAAFRCGVTQTAVLQMCSANNNGIAFPFLGANFTAKQGGDSAGDPSPYWTHHMIAHNPTRVPGQKNAVDRWFVQQFADLLQMLKDVPEGDGSMLDNTAVLFANNMSDGGAHNINNLPWLMAGGCGGAFKTGRFLELGTTSHGKLLTTVANAILAGANLPTLDAFGDKRYGTGELTRLKG